MQEINNINTGLDIKLNKSTSLYHAIQDYMNIIQGKTEPNNALKLRFDNIYESMELSRGGTTSSVANN